MTKKDTLDEVALVMQTLKVKMQEIDINDLDNVKLSNLKSAAGHVKDMLENYYSMASYKKYVAEHTKAIQNKVNIVLGVEEKSDN